MNMKKFKCFDCKKTFEVKEPEATEIEGDCSYCGSMKIKKVKKSDLSKYPIKLAGMIWGKKKYYCSWCTKEVKGFKDKLSAKEFRVSGLCQKCQDVNFT